MSERVTSATSEGGRYGVRARRGFGLDRTLERRNRRQAGYTLAGEAIAKLEETSVTRIGLGTIP